MKNVCFAIFLLLGVTSCEVLDEMAVVNGQTLSAAMASGGSSRGRTSGKSQASGWVQAAGTKAWIYFPNPGRDDSNRSAADGIYEWSGGVSPSGNANGIGTLTWRTRGSAIYQYYGTLQEGVLEGDFLKRTHGSNKASSTRFSRSRERGGNPNLSGDVSRFAKVSLDPPTSATDYRAPKPPWAPVDGTMRVHDIKRTGRNLGQNIYFLVTGTKYHIANTNGFPVWVRIQLYKVNPFGETELGGKIERRIEAQSSIWRPYGGVWNRGKLLKMAKAE